MISEELAIHWIKGAATAVLLSAAVIGQFSYAEQSAKKNPARKVDFSVKAQPLADALVDLSEQAEIQLLVPDDLLENHSAPALEGRWDINTALEFLLSEAGLESVFASGNTVVIRSKSNNSIGVISNEQERKMSNLKLKPVSAAIIALTSGISTLSYAENATDEVSENNRGAEIEEVMVTGSRVSRSTFETPTPTEVIDREDIVLSGFNNVGDILLRTPSVGVGLGATNSWYSNDAGASFINLRGLGVDRTLVLVNGRRRVAGTQSSSAVDLTTVPANMIKNIEIITGGASAVYGADAVSGVVNVQLNDEFEGLNLSARTGMNDDGDAQSSTLNMLGGLSFHEGRGSVTFGLTYNDADPLFLRERSDILPTLMSTSNPANGGPADGIPDNITYRDWHVPLLAYGGAFFDTNGDLYTINNDLKLIECDVLAGAFGYGCNPDDGYNPIHFDQLRHQQETLSTMINFNYELSDSTKFFLEASFANTNTTDSRVPTTTFFTPIARDNPFIPADVAALMDDQGLDTIEVSRAHRDHGVQKGRIDRDTYTIVAGFEGQFKNEWDWSASYQYGKYEQELRTERSHVTSRFLEATDVISDAISGDPICRDATARANGCQPLNILGQDVATADALAYLQHTRVLRVENEQEVFAGLITGDLIQLPAGPLGFAFGAEYRKEALSTKDDPLAEANLLFIDDNGGPPTNADYDVKEVFFEAVAPLISDAKFAHDLSVEVAARYSDYSTIGGTTAWKFGASWSPIEDVRFRATRSQSVRAPSLAELYSPGVNRPGAVQDPCDATRINLGSSNRAANCQALGLPSAGWTDDLAISRQIFSGGNPDLQEETSDSMTIGVVFTPTSLDGFRASFDLWKIEIEDAINSIGFQDILDKCVDSEGINNAFCPLVTRDSDFLVQRVSISDINIGKLEASGVDFNLQYGFDFASDSTVSFALSGTYLSKLEELVDESDLSTLIISNGEFNNPNWRANFSTNYLSGPLKMNWNMRFISSSKVDVQASDEFYDRPKVSSRIYHDVSTTYEFNETYSVFLGVNNLLDQKPPRVSGVYGGRGAGLFDNIGRYFFVGVNATF